MMLIAPIEKVENLSAEAFSNMKKLRLLNIQNTRHSKDLFRGNVQLLQGLSYLSNELRFLEWHGYHLKFLPNNFQPNKLVKLRMCFSGIRQLWKGVMVRFSLIKMCNLFNFI